MTPTSFSTYSGPEFLLFYLLLVLAAVIAGFWIPGHMRPRGRAGVGADANDLAYMAGGMERVVLAAIARLVGAGALEATGNGKLVAVRPDAGTDAIEREVLQTGGEFTLAQARAGLKGQEASMLDRLIAAGLAMDEGQRNALRWKSVAPYLLVLLVGVWRWLAGNEQGEPVGLLSFAVVAVAGLAIWRFASLDPLTQAGDAALEEAQARHARLKSAPTQAELGFGVALFGTAILVGTPYADVHELRHVGQGDGGGFAAAGDGDGGDGGGGCGGGCGGCGG